MRKLLLLLFLIPLFLKAQVHFPVDETNTICFQGDRDIKASVETLLRRAKEFAVVSKFSGAKTINTRSGGTFNGGFFEKDFDFIDTIDNRLRGSGYIEYSPGKSYMYVTFDYQISVKANWYHFAFKNFRVIQFLRPPHAKSNGFRIYGFSTASGDISSSISKSTRLADLIAQIDSERRKSFQKINYQDLAMFKDNMTRLLRQLDNTMQGVF